jgi:hypothetical protein
MKRFFARNKRVVEIVLTLALVFLVAGYYYLIYVPERETELIARRFRTLQRIEQNMREKLDGYKNTIKNCLVKGDKPYFRQLVAGYNTDTTRFHLLLIDSGTITRPKAGDNKDSQYIKLLPAFVDSIAQSSQISVGKNGKKLLIFYNWYKFQDVSHDNIKHITLCASIDYGEFVQPLLKKSVFDQYIVFNVQQETSNIVFEDFPSGISFKGLDSLFDTKEKVYTSKIVKIETGGEKYLVFLHPCGYNNKNDRIVAGLLKQKSFDAEKRRLPDNVVTAMLFITLFLLLLLPVIRLALMGKKERIRFVDLFTGYFAFLLLVPVIMLAFFWNNKSFIDGDSNRVDSKKILAGQISKSLVREIEAAYNLLDTFDRLHSSDSLYPNSIKLAVLQSLNIRHLRDSAYPRYFDNDKRPNGHSVDSAVHLLDSILQAKNDLYKNTEYVFWMDSTGKEFSNWAFGDDPPRGDYNQRPYFKNVQENKLLSLPGQPGKTYTIDALVSRIDGRFKVVLAKKSHDKKSVVASPSRFESVTNPVLPVGYQFSIIDADGKTVFDSDTTENLNENLTEEFVEGAQLKVVLNTKTAREFETRHEDDDFKVLAQPIPGLPYTIVILENKSFTASLYTQCLSFTMVMMFSFFIFLCFEMGVILIAHKQSTKLLKNNFDFAWIHPRMNFSAKYLALFLFNSFVLLVLILFCFIGFSARRLPEYMFLIVVASLVTSIAAFAFKATHIKANSAGNKQLKSEKNTMKLLALVIFIALIHSVSYDVFWHLLLFITIVAAGFFLLFKNRFKFRGNSDYMENFRLMIFSRLLLTSGLPVIVFFNCIYNFEQRLQERLKLLDYAEKVQERSRETGTSADVTAQLSDQDIVRSLYVDKGWVSVGDKNDAAFTNTAAYSKTDSFCMALLKTAHLHYGDVSDSTEGFELIRPFSNNTGKVSSQFVFNNIFTGTADTIKYKMAEPQNDTSLVSILSLASASNQYFFPSIFKSSAQTIFWILLFACIGFTYLLLMYATNKIFGKYIPDIDDFKKIHDDLLIQKNIKYLFVQGIPGSGKSSFIKNNLAKSFIFCDKQKQPDNYNATFFNLSEIPGTAEMAMHKADFDKVSQFNKPKKDNWFYKVSEIVDDKIECVVFTHFEYKIFDEYVNDVKLTLIEKLLGLGKKKIILSSDIDPLEYFYSLKKFMPSNANAKNSTNNPTADNSFFEFQNRWNNLLGRFANIFMNLDNIPVSKPGIPFRQKFLNEECSNPAFLKNYITQFQSMPIDEDNEEDYILKIQSLCDHSYRQIFSSLTKEEQLTLYDLAEDGLMNTTNYMSLTMLLSKGLVIKDKTGVLMIVNRSFRNFILTMVKAEDVKSIEKEINDDHTWNDYKYPVFILLGALLYFVLSSNPEKFGNVLPVVTGVLAGIPTILKMLSFMKPGESKN